MSESSSVVAGVKRKMRKGTASCIECRRRKIKCIFIHGDSKCANCLARGTQCIDQRDVNGIDDFAPEESTTSLRERVANLERQLAAVVKSIKGDLHQHRALEHTLETPDGSDIEPPVAEPEPTLPSIVSDIHGHWSFEKGQNGDNIRVSRPERKASEICKALRSFLPNLDALADALEVHGSWWPHWRRQVQPEGEAIEDITAFVYRTYASRSPGDLGCLVAAYARHVWKGKYYLYGYVESLVTSDATYASTTEGLECLILLAQSYLDVGQPRRAWLTFQRGIALSRMMRLDRHYFKNSKEAALWWSLYLGDRGCSMLLGLPSNVNDSQHGLRSDEGALVGMLPQRRFMVRCAIVAGSIMERCTRDGAPFSVGLSQTDDLEAEMNSVAMSVPDEWWSLPKSLPVAESELDLLRARLLQQTYYFHVRMHIYLSHLGEATGSPHWQRKLKCMEAARQLLRRTILLTQWTGELRFFECKTNEFVGFIAASVLTIGLFSLGNDVDQPTVSEDQYLIDTMRNTFKHEEMIRRCQIARQCGHTLELLVNPRTAHENDIGEKIVIPYFGTVVKKELQPATNRVPTSVNIAQDKPVITSIDGQVTSCAPLYQPTGPTQALDSNDQSTPDLFFDNLYWELENGGSFMSGDFNPMLDPAMIDLAQDWSVFSNFDESPFNQPM